MLNIHEQLTNFTTEKLNLKTGFWINLSVDLILVLGLLLISWLIYLVAYKLVVKSLTRWFKKTNNTWDDEFINSRIIRRFSRLVPAVVLWSSIPLVLRVTQLSYWSQVVLTIILIVISLSVIFSALNTILRFYERTEVSKEMPLQGIAQTLKIILSIAAFIFILATILGKSPALIFSGFGAMTAILMLVFKDAILGLAAGIQLSMNRMVAVGDWIEVPKYGADGNVLELALTTVKVQNWDKTITTIPTYSLISDSFKNWRGMSESGMRRIKRSLNINLYSIRFLEETDIERLRELDLLKEYLNAKEQEITDGNSNGTTPQQYRRLTNLGTFRAYLRAYLEEHTTISNDATRLVRQLQPTEKGIPLELYIFSSDNNWVNFENLQSDLFDHFISILPDFDLSLHQDPSGDDFKNLASK